MPLWPLWKIITIAPYDPDAIPESAWDQRQNMLEYMAIHMAIWQYIWQYILAIWQYIWQYIWSELSEGVNHSNWAWSNASFELALSNTYSAPNINQ